MVVRFPRACPGCRLFHPGTLGLLARALGDVGYILGRAIHMCALCRSLGSSEVVGLSRVHRSGRWVYPRSLRLLVRARPGGH